jgi:hypothetical protein
MKKIIIETAAKIGIQLFYSGRTRCLYNENNQIVAKYIGNKLYCFQT